MRYLLFLLALPLLAQPANLQIQDVTGQQMHASYTAPSSSACTLGVTDNSGFGVTVWDVNAKFTGSTSDLSRSNTQTNGLNRIVEIGLRAAQAGTDGLIYSRSLQNNTGHTLTVTCGSAVSINFTTLPQPIGRTNPEPSPYLSTGANNSAWPTYNPNSPGPQIDPLTGALLLTGPLLGDVAMVSTSLTYAVQFDSSATWTNPANILAAPGGVTATSATANPIFVAFAPLRLNPNGSNLVSSNYVGLTVTGVRVCLYGSGTDASATNRQVAVKLTLDSGQTAFSGTVTLTLPQTTPATVCWPAAGTAITEPGYFSDWALASNPQHNMVVPGSYTVSTVGAAVTASGSVAEGSLGTGFFPQTYPAGARVVISGTQYAVSSVTDGNHITLATSAGTQGPIAMTAANSGMTISKTTATGSVSLSATYDWAYTDAPTFYAGTDGATVQCSPNTKSLTVNAAGSTVTAYLARVCILSYPGIASGVYLLRPDTGAFWQVGTLYNTFGQGFASDPNILLGQNPFDPTDPITFYGISEDLTTDNRIVAKYSYTGTGQSYTTGPLPDSTIYTTVPNGQSQTGTTCTGGWQTAGNLCSTPLTGVIFNCASLPCTGLMPSQSMDAAKGAFCGNAQPIGVLGTTYVLFAQCQQDAIAGVSYISLSTGLGLSFKDTMFSETGFRFGGLHTPEGFMDGNHHMLANNPLGSRGNSGGFAGPYSSALIDLCLTISGSSCTNYSATTTLSAGLSYTCPAPTCGAGNVSNALLFRIAGQPCSAFASMTEQTSYPCTHGSGLGMLSAMAVGDLLGDLANNVGGSGEEMQVLAITVNSSTDIAVWVQRSYNGSGFDTHANGWGVTEFPTPNSCTSAYWWYNNLGVGPFAENCTQISHFDVAPNSANYVIDAFLNFKNAVANSTGAAVALSAVQPFGIFMANVAGTNWPGNGLVEDYPSCRAGSFLPWCEVWNSYQDGSFQSGGYGNANASVTITAVNSVYKISSGLSTNYKQVPMEAWAARYVMHDVSGPSCSVTTSTPYTFGVVLASNECTSGSTPGDIVFYIPGLLATGGGHCWTNSLEVNGLPCIVPASPIGDWISLHDGTNSYGGGVVRLSKGFCGPGRQYTAWNWRSDPAGQWGFVACPFEDGIAPNMFLMKMPPIPAYDAVRRDFFQPIKFQLGITAAFSEVRFGYEENGAANAFNCTSRSDACLSISGNAGTSYNFLSVDGHSGTACTSGCVVTVPAISGRVMWWQQWISTDNVTYAAVGSPAALTVP